MSVLTQRRPRFSVEEAAKIANEIFGIDAKATDLPSERDQNFLLAGRPGENYVLKIANSGEDARLLEMQNQVMAYLAERVPRLRFPALSRAKSGQDIATLDAGNGDSHLVRMLTHLPGHVFAGVRPHSQGLLRSLGAALSEIDRSLFDFRNASARRNIKWDASQSSWARENLHAIADPYRRESVNSTISIFDERATARVEALRRSIIHNDANDHNMLVGFDSFGYPEVDGIIDFGDMIEAPVICELGVALAYALMGKVDALESAVHIVSAYHQVLPLEEAELAALYYVICMRLSISLVNSAISRECEPENEYLQVSDDGAWSLLRSLLDSGPNLAEYTFRSACGFEPCPNGGRVRQWLAENRHAFAPVVAADLTDPRATIAFDLSVGSLDLDAATDIYDMGTLGAKLLGTMRAAGATAGIGRYNETRLFYTTDIFRIGSNDEPHWRTVHIGVDIFMKPFSPVYAPMSGSVHSLRNNAGPLDYGPTICLEHRTSDGLPFYTLYGHLSKESLEGLYRGKRVKKGERIASIGTSSVNGGWPPHLHFQIIADMLGKLGDFPGVAPPEAREVWLSICPDPNLILNIAEETFPAPDLAHEDIVERRRKNIGPSLSIAYRKPLNIVRGYMQHLIDEHGQVYLDGVNNVSHVGHCHPKVVQAARRQIGLLNTNTRYLHKNLVLYAERLCRTLPEPLRVCYFVCSGSEANELALRLAHAHTGARDVIVVDGAYHGNTAALIDVSPYKFEGPGGMGAPDHVRVVPMPDVFRGPHASSDPEAGKKYAGYIRDAVETIAADQRSLSAFICESMLGCGGQIVLPGGYLKDAYRYVRDAGGVCIADEVQTGFGRTGSHFWAFELQGVVPDIITLGKPIGNGHPMGAVITTPEIAASFDNGMEYFNTFGGNPVSCAIGMAVLDVIEDERLQEHSHAVGERLKTGLQNLKLKHELIGDVRGEGLFLGAELVQDRLTLEPAPVQAAYVVERMKDRGILLSTDGPLHNVLKIKPPLVFSHEDADRLVDTLDALLSETFLRDVVLAFQKVARPVG